MTKEKYDEGYQSIADLIDYHQQKIYEHQRILDKLRIERNVYLDYACDHKYDDGSSALGKMESEWITIDVVIHIDDWIGEDQVSEEGHMRYYKRCKICNNECN